MADRIRAEVIATVFVVTLVVGSIAPALVPRSSAAEMPDAEVPPIEAIATDPSESDAEPATPAIEQKSADRDDLPSLAEVLGAESDEALEAPRLLCINTRQIRTHDVLDSQHLVFRMRGGESYLVRFPRRCPGLAGRSAIEFESRAGRLCRSDTINVVQVRGFGGFDGGAPCIIQGFQPVTPEQLEYLKISLERQRKKNRKR